MTKKYLSFNRQTPTQESILIGRKLQTGVYNVGGKELTLIFSIPVRSIKPLLVSLGFENIDNNLQKNISVYSFYDKKDYFLDFITYHGTDEEFLELIEQKNTQVLINTDALAYNEDTFVISFNEQQCNSFFGDKPNFLQNENYEQLVNYNFLCQISANDLPNELQDLFYLNDAVGYIFLKNNLDSGIFFVQTT